MDSIQQCICDFPSTPLYFIIGISFAFNHLIKNGLIIEPKKWGTFRNNQSLQTTNEHQKGEISTLEKNMSNLMGKIQSMVKGAETLPERIRVAKFNN